jgi:hypothetical protein
MLYNKSNVWYFFGPTYDVVNLLDNRKDISRFFLFIEGHNLKTEELTGPERFIKIVKLQANLSWLYGFSI